MTTAITQVQITAKDSTAAAFASAQRNLSNLAANAAQLTASLGAIGATAAVGSIIKLTKATLEAQDNLSKLSQKTGIAVETLAGLEFASAQSGVELEKVARLTRQFAVLVAESGDKTSTAAKQLESLGLKYKDLKDLSPEKQLLALTDALSKFSQQDQVIAFTSIFGQKMTDLIPLLSGGSAGLAQMIEQGRKLNPVTEESAKKAEQFNDQIDLLTRNVGALGREFVQGLIPSLNRISNEMVRVTQTSGILSGALAGVKQFFVESFGNPKILGDVGTLRREILKTQDTITKMESKKDSIFFDKNALQHEKDKLEQLETDLKKAIIVTRETFATTDKATESTKRFAIAVDSADKSNKKSTSSQSALNKQIKDSYRIESEYIKLLEIERKQHADMLRPYEQGAKAAKDRVQSMRQENAALELSQIKQISLEQAIEETTIARLQEKKAITKNVSAVAEIEKEIEARKQIISIIQQSGTNAKTIATINQQAADQTTQFWVQANRNIQSSLASGIFDSFSDGLDGMVRNVKNTVLRIISEFAALKVLEFFGGTAGGTGGTGGTISTLAGLAGMFGGMRTGGTTTGVFSNAGGAGTAFVGGPGTALGGSGMGVNATRGTGLGTGSIASIGAMAGPYGMAAAAAVIALQALEKKVGDYKLSGGAKFALGAYETFSPMAYVVKGLGLQTPEALIGKFLFGRGPYKLRQQSLQGSLSNQGIDGTLTDVFRSKGGVFVNNKHKSFENDLPSEIYRDVDKTVKSIYKSTHEFSKNLGLDVSQIDTYTKEIQIKSEKGKTLTTEAVSDMLTGFADDVAKLVMPNIESFALTGESASKTFARLNNELESLKNGAQNLGASVAYADQIISAMSIDARSAFIDQAGGIDKLNELTSSFFDGFLSNSEQLDIRSNQLSGALSKLGLSADLTKDQFKGLVQSIDTSDEVRIGLLELVPAFLAVRNAQDQLNGTTNDLIDSESQLGDIRNRMVSAYQKERSEVEQTMSKFKDVAQQIKGFRESLALSDLSPLNPGEKLNEARRIFNETRAKASQGDQEALSQLPSAAQEFLKASQTYNASSSAFISDFNLVQNVLKNAESSALSQIEIAQNQLDALDQSVKYLIDIKENTKTLADLIRDLNIGVLTGSGNRNISTQQIKDFISANPGMSPQNVANAATQYGVSLSQLGAAGYDTSRIVNLANSSGVSDAQIADFARKHTPREIYDAAQQFGISSQRLSRATGISIREIEQWVKANGLPSFAKGTDFITKTGLALVHKAEAIVPSSTTNEIKKLREELSKLRTEQNRQTGDTINVIDISNKQNALMISQALRDAENNRAWTNRNQIKVN